MGCNCKPVRKPYSERTHDEEWQYPPCQCKQETKGFGDLTPAQIERLKRDNAEASRPSWLAERYLGSMGRSHAGHEESAARSREMTEMLARIAMLEKRLALQESISRDHDAVLKYTTDRINRMERHGPKVLHFGEERLETKELKPGPVTANAFDAPEQSNAKELPKHAKELRSEVIVEVNSDGSLSISESTPLSAGDAHTFSDETRLRYSDHDLVLRPRQRPLMDKVIDAIRSQPALELVLVSFTEPTTYGGTMQRTIECKPGEVVEIPPRAYAIRVTRTR